MSDENELMAIVEMERLRNSHAWSPINKPTKKKCNQHCSRYTFEDRSELTIYYNGDAAWFYRKPNGETPGLQRWRAWHHCNT